MPLQFSSSKKTTLKPCVENEQLQLKWVSSNQTTITTATTTTTTRRRRRRRRIKRNHHFPTAITTCRFLPPAPLWNFTAFLHVPLNLWLCLGRGWHPRNVTKHMYIPTRKAIGSMGLEYLPTFGADFLWFQWEANIPVPMEPMGKLYRN